jgi:tRNA nucleotidyltransferase (CCA-adding enzyme)
MPDTLIDKLQAQLTPEARVLLDAVIEQAARQDLRAFLVGGTVRDLLLNREALDVDISIEGDAIALAQAVAASTGAKLAKTTVFGTATLTTSGFRLDLATARAETYARPGALPKVRPSTIDDDLLRRDFTINAIAVELTGPAPGKTLDPTGGVRDLHTGLVHVLHERSFQDDATRIVRAVRYAARFGFRIEESTLDLIARDLSFLEKISGTRLRQEMARVFAEEHPARAVAQLRDLGVLRAIHPALDPNDKQIAAFQSIRGTDPATAWALLASNTSESDASALIRRLALTRKQSEAVRAMPALRALAPQLTPDLRPSELAKLLSPFPEPALIACSLAGDPAAAQRIRDYLDRNRTVRPILRGDDIVELGVPRGPEVANVLADLRAARLDGEVTTREDEVSFVDAYLARELVGLD